MHDISSLLQTSGRMDLKAILDGDAKDSGRAKKTGNKKPEQQDTPTLPEGITQPAPEKVTRRFQLDDGRQVLPGYGASNPDILFVGAFSMFEDCRDDSGAPRHLRSFAGAVFERMLLRAGITTDQWAYTTLIKYPMKGKIKKADINWNKAAFEHDLQRYKPKVVVCLGKPAFDYLVQIKFNQKEVQGGFFDAPGHDFLVYCADPMTVVSRRPEKLERLYVDLKQVKIWVEESRGLVREKIPIDYGCISTRKELQEFVEFLRTTRQPILSVDCEWGRDPNNPYRPVTFTDGKLRSLQICWKPGCARYIRFRDEKEQHSMDCSYEEAGEILGSYLNKPFVKYIGHNIAADLVWMHHVLGLNVYGKVVWDTMFAEQTINENADQKLERLAMKYTTLGRYDKPLLVYKKRNREIAKVSNEDVGFALIPDSVLIPYGCADVDTPMRTWTKQAKALELDGTYSYFVKFRLPFVTDGFFHMAYHGLPTSKRYLDELRDNLRLVYNEVSTTFKEQMWRDSVRMFREQLLSHTSFTELVPTLRLVEDGFLKVNGLDAAKDLLKIWAGKHAKPECREPGSVVVFRILEFLRHMLTCRITDPENPKIGFNIRSGPHMIRWLYSIKGLTPIKTTKMDGIQMAWEKVPAERAHEYTPSVDVSSLKVFATHDPDVDKVLEVNAIGNLLKAFLKDPDEQTGAENGLHKWLCVDGKIHSNFVLTESNRPRSFNPNVLNIPKRMAKPIMRAVERLQKMGKISNEMEIFSIRSCVGFEETDDLEDGWCIVDTDLQTAEIVGLAYLSGDEPMLKSCTEDDTQFALRPVEGGDPKPVRIAWDLSVTEVPEGSITSVELTDPSDPGLLRDENAMLVHPRRDQHWELAESFMQRPRELIDREKYRDGLAKTGNFSISYGATPGLLERRYREETGLEPEEGMGQKVIDAWAAKNAVAWGFLDEQEQCVFDPGYVMGVAGLKRHFILYDDMGGLSHRQVESLTSGLRREARNFPMQNAVAETTARAHLWLIDAYRQLGLSAYNCLLLYDALSTVCRVKERWVVKALHKMMLSTKNFWPVNGRELRFGVDTDFAFRLGKKPSDGARKSLYMTLPTDLDPKEYLARLSGRWDN